MKSPVPSPALPTIAAEDSWLAPFASFITARGERYRALLQQITAQYGSLKAFASAWQWMGITRNPATGAWTYREWAPAARALALVGDFNHWDGNAHPLAQRPDGVWELELPATALNHGDQVKVRVTNAQGLTMDRLPAYLRYAVQDAVSHDFCGVIWEPATPYIWKHATFEPAWAKGDAPLIYECHTGMAQEREGVGTYREFADVVLPRVKALGYNTIQMMAVQEHPYYGSFGYHVSNFFAPSSRFGTPDDLRYLIDTAHGMGIAVIMDIVHSHAVKNMAEGLNDFDGSGGQYFHTGGRGYHEGWDSKCFDYGKWEVQQFLLSNCSYWLEEFNFDGYRFDGVTSLLYLHHGNISFGNYDSYFRNGVDWDAETYLTLANLLIHEVKSNALSIAEDMSGMPGLCRKPEDGGIGFDFRLAMGLPDYWIKLLKHSSDDHWDMFGLWYELTNRRQREKTIAYAESHDQALVGDKTIAFWLMDAAMYTDMSVFTESLIVDRGIALHKLIRLVTLALGGEAYLNFMGNEFGHPEWIDFPREGNGWSHRYARRQWSLPDTEHLKYKYLEAFDKGMLPLITEKHVLTSGFAKQRYLQNDQKLLVFERGDVIFAFNFHPSQPTEDLRFMVEKEGNYRIVLNSDLPEYGGFDRIDNTYLYETEADDKGDIWLQVYLPNRMALVLELVAGE